MRADAQAKRQKIIEAATEQFRTRTNSEVTLEGIAKDAGVGIATLYRHFPRREDLRLACALSIFDTLEGVLAETMSTFDDAPAATWESAILGLADYGIGVLVSALTDEAPPNIRGEVLAKRDQFFSRVQLLLSKAAEHGLVDPDLAPLEMAAELIVATRPLPAAANQVFPDVKNRLVRHLITAWRQPASPRSDS